MIILVAQSQQWLSFCKSNQENLKTALFANAY
jgi:hypothetical protein